MFPPSLCLNNANRKIHTRIKTPNILSYLALVPESHVAFGKNWAEGDELDSVEDSVGVFAIEELC